MKFLLREEDIEGYMADMQAEYQKENEARKNRYTLCKVWHEKRLRLPLLIVIIIPVFTQFMGISVVSDFYSVFSSHNYLSFV